MKISFYLAFATAFAFVVAGQSAYADEPAANVPEIKDEDEPKAAVGKTQRRTRIVVNVHNVDQEEPIDAKSDPKSDAATRKQKLEAEAEPMIQELLVRLRPMLISELRFIRLACFDLTVDQRQQTRVLIEARLRQEMKAIALQQVRQQRGNMLGRSVGAADSPKVVRQAVQQAIFEVFTDEQRGRYEEADSHRMAGRKHAAILSVIARLDEQLFLTQEQRDQISESLSTKWKVGWEAWLMMSPANSANQLPAVPEQCIGKYLNADQKSIWSGIQKVNYAGWPRDLAQDMADDEWWGPVPGKDQGPKKVPGVDVEIFDKEVLVR